MKKIIAIIGLAAIATGLHAQGLVSFYDLSANLTTNSAMSIYSGGSGVGGTSGKIAGTPSGFYFTVLISSSNPGTSNPTNAAWTQAIFAGSPIVGTNYPGVAGDMQGPTGTQKAAIDNWASGSTMSYLIAGWSANLGTSWATVSSELATGWSNIAGYSANNAYFFGTSTVATGASGTPPTGTPLALFTGTGGFGLYQVAPVAPVPEPTTMALAGLGGAALLLFRRRK